MKISKTALSSYLAEVSPFYRINKWPIIVFGFVFVLSLLAGVFTINQSLNSQKNFQNLKEENLEATLWLSNAERALWQLRFSLPTYIVEETDARIKIKKEDLHWFDIIHKNIGHYLKMVKTPQEKKIYDKFLSAFSEYLILRLDYFKLVDEGKIEQANLFRSTVIEPAATRTVDAISSLLQHQHDAANLKLEEVSMQVKETRTLITFFILLETLLCIGLLKALSISNKKMYLINQQSMQNSKMASLGEMSANIAHEINNPLAIITGKTLQLLKLIRSGDCTPEIETRHLEKILETSERIAKIIKGMKSVTRNSDNDPFHPVSLHVLSEHIKSLCSERFRTNEISFEISTIPEASIECRSGQIEQVIFNLLNNAFDAVSPLSEKWIHLEFKASDHQVQIIVTDSGAGVPSNIVNRLMLPFFTTKEVGKGTGLGLSISKTIVEEHYGQLYYDSTCPNTRFVIELPRKHCKENQTLSEAA